ncbi:hypothetical protein INT47_000932 [Mucor saturninus]|uniref:Uncharacterized protein n=1 Tax=Mucor saturninus TaxID=64648 RepID=A0A8H7RNJ2_9FUNG|nr:hypothetical protein INT47_000932 [Mucor saturninus]
MVEILCKTFDLMYYKKHTLNLLVPKYFGGDQSSCDYMPFGGDMSSSGGYSSDTDISSGGGQSSDGDMFSGTVHLLEMRSLSEMLSFPVMTDLLVMFIFLLTLVWRD